ncbi:hypothetical protein FB567DRAFT_544934 [Paraphoma chrysanthemicola]|uniref:Uncharacterized protein n=1 Tax=Paraphoma chrysanthemicola TaxID=798071 RepID=A0A8K0RHV9_9PLEO|nr:hypothetical protein FB567DRAFT_544934 [Paraphoma chrysanthemicola]
MIPDCIPIPMLTKLFKKICTSQSTLFEGTLLKDYLIIIRTLDFLGTIVATAFELHRGGIELFPNQVLWHPTVRTQILEDHFADFDTYGFVEVVIEEIEVFKGLHPYTVNTYDAGVSPDLGQLWLIGCAIHPEADTDMTLEPVLGRFIGPTPHDCLPHMRPEQLSSLGLEGCLEVPSSHPMPELAIALEQLFTLRKDDARLAGSPNIGRVLFFFRTG